ncbi:hypothetical protein, variant [Fonticula alba]|uniref:V-SNARE coiled-coil homology domain-containing protein n=1 Tax=Fonticula alba TaxID=691883 RepID=A0A058Z9Y9_FONAL|nr:hypothetical protein, variant [Fonticula alba]KCV71104.1 hypothetical protein, variant [Fonticula alba]|eukprot:XP_009494226.1 hypothetical protein, variant [Fonticula alba]
MALHTRALCARKKKTPHKPTHTHTHKRTSIDYHLHCQSTVDGLCCIVVCDSAYPSNVVFRMSNQLLMDYRERYPVEVRRTATAPLPLPKLSHTLQQAVDVKNIDSFSRINDDLDQTQVVLLDTINAMLERGQKLGDLVQQSEDLSLQSKAFYTQAKKQNSWCCSVM